MDEKSCARTSQRKKSLKGVLQLVDTSWGKRNTIRFYIALCQDSSDKKVLRGSLYNRKGKTKNVSFLYSNAISNFPIMYVPSYVWTNTGGHPSRAYYIKDECIRCKSSPFHH